MHVSNLNPSNDCNVSCHAVSYYHWLATQREASEKRNVIKIKKKKDAVNSLSTGHVPYFFPDNPALLTAKPC